MIQNKIQIDEKDFEFIQKAYKLLSYKSLSHYMREAIQAKVREDRKKVTGHPTIGRYGTDRLRRL